MQRKINYPLSGLSKKASVNWQPLVDKAVPLATTATLATLGYRNSKENKIRNAILSGLVGYLGGQLINPYWTPISNALAARDAANKDRDRRSE